VRLSEVRLLVDGQQLAYLHSPPFKALWVLEPGQHSIVAQGFDAAGQRVLSEAIQIEVQD
jgi:hypothetical protein